MPALALRSMPPSPPLVSRRPDALFVGISPFLLSRRVQLAQLAARDAVPAIYQDREHAEVGGLMSYGASLTDVYRQVGVYSGRILKGAQPADLPVVQANKFGVGHQRPDRQDAWPRNPLDTARDRRRGDRMTAR